MEPTKKDDLTNELKSAAINYDPNAPKIPGTQLDDKARAR